MSPNTGPAIRGFRALDSEAADRVVRPLFDVVEILDIISDRGSHALRPGTRCTIQRFFVEQGRAIGRALLDLPPSADPRLHALAAVHDAERYYVYRDQGLAQVADDAGLPIDFVAGRRIHIGCTDLAKLLEQGGLIPAKTEYDLDAFETTGGTLRAADRGSGLVGPAG
jgi:hypothetical protein